MEIVIAFVILLTDTQECGSSFTQDFQTTGLISLIRIPSGSLRSLAILYDIRDDDIVDPEICGFSVQLRTDSLGFSQRISIPDHPMFVEIIDADTGELLEAELVT